MDGVNYKQASSLVVIVVILWLGGFGCSLCCMTGATDSGCLERHLSSVRVMLPVAGAATCDAGAACSCCKVRRAERRMSMAAEAIGRDGALGCSLLPNQIEGMTVQVRVTGVQAAVAGLSEPHIIPCGPARTASLLDPLPPLNRGGTYLRCGALLI